MRATAIAMTNTSRTSKSPTETIVTLLNCSTHGGSSEAMMFAPPEYRLTNVRNRASVPSVTMIAGIFT